MIADFTNSMFEFLGGAFVAISVVKLHKDKIAHGVSWVTVAFFASWSYWNLYYYPSLGQIWSFYGGVVLGTMNTIWVLQLLYYTKYPFGREYR